MHAVGAPRLRRVSNAAAADSADPIATAAAWWYSTFHCCLPRSEDSSEEEHEKEGEKVHSVFPWRLALPSWQFLP